MGIRNRDGALYTATGMDNSGLYSGCREAIGIFKAMASEITSFDVFSGIGISAATAFAKAAKSSYDFEKEFRKNMLEVATISTQVTDDMTGFMNQVMSITQEIPVTAPEAAKALYQIVSAGHDGADGMRILEVSARSAIGGMTDTATAADAITTLLNAYKLSAADAENVSDQLFTTARLGKTTFGELGQSIAQVAPIAASYGVEMDQVLAAVATLTKSGVPTAQAMTQIRASIIGVSKVLGDGAFNTRTYQEALAEVATMAGGSESKLRELIPEVEAVNGVLGMTGIKAQDAASHLAEMNASAGATETAFKQMMDDVDKQMALLSNNIQAALRPMGEAILKEVSEVAKSFNEAFDNGDVKESMKTLGDLIVIVTGAFIGYKGAVLASTVVQKINMAILRQAVLERRMENVAVLNGVVGHQALTAAQLREVAARKIVISTIKVQTAAMLKNMAALATNPYVLAAAAISALGYGIYKYATQATAAEKAQANFIKRVEEQKRITEEMRDKTSQLLDVARDEAETDHQRNKALKSLKDLYPDIFKKYDIEALKLADILEIKKQIAELDEQRSYGSDKAYFVSLVNKRDKLDNELSYRSVNYGNGQYKYSEFQDKNVYELRKEREGIAKEIDLMYSDIKEKSAAIWENSAPKEVKIVSLEKNIEALRKEKEEIEKIISPNDDFVSSGKPAYNPLGQAVSPAAIARLKVLNELINTQSVELAELSSTTKAGDDYTVLERKIKLTKELSEANANLIKLREPDSKASDSEIKASEDKVKEIKGKLEALTGLSTKDNNTLQSEQSDRLRAIEDYRKSISEAGVQAELDIRQQGIEAMDEGSKKELAMIHLNYDRLRDANRKRANEMIKERQELERKQWEYDNPGWKEKGMAFKPTTTSVQQLSPSQRRQLLAYDDLADIQRQKATKDYLDKERQAMDEYLKEYGTYMEKRQAITDLYNEKIAKASPGGEKMTLKRQLGEELRSLDLSEFKKGINFAEVFGNLDNLTPDSITRLRDKLKEYINKAASGLRPEDLKELSDALTDIEIKTAEKNPFGEIGKGLEDYRKATEGVEDAQDKLNYVMAGGEIITGLYDDGTGKLCKKLLTQEEAEKNLVTAQDERAESLARMNTALAAGVGKAQDYLDVAKAMVGALEDFGVEVPEQLTGFIDGMGKAFDSLASINLTNPVSIIKGAIGVIGGLGKAIGSLFNNDSKKQKNIERLQDQIDVLDKSYEKLGRSIEKAYSKDASGLIDQQNKLLGQQKVLIQQQMSEEESKKHTDDEKMQAYRDQLDEINDTIADNKEKAKDAIFGEDLKSAIENFADAYADAWASGENRAKSAKDTVRNMMRQMVTESIKAAMESSKAMEQIRTKLEEFYADNVLSGWEQDYIYKMTEGLQREMDDKFGWADSLMRDEGTDPTREATAKGIASISQDSANVIDGKMSSQLIYLDKTLVEVTGIREQMRFIYDMQVEGWKDVKAIRELSGKVSENTARVAEISGRIEELSGKIETNTGKTARGIQDMNDRGLTLRK